MSDIDYETDALPTALTRLLTTVVKTWSVALSCSKYHRALRTFSIKENKTKKDVSDICDRVNNQLRVIKPFRNIVSSNTKTRLYKAFIMPYFLYCSNVWHFCGAGNARKLELLDKQALRLIFDDNDNTYETLLNNLNMTTLQTRRIQDMFIMVYKALHALTPAYITSLFILRRNTQGLRGINKLYQPRVNTTNYGKNSFKFTATKYWNILTDKLRTAPSVTNFRNNIKSFIC